MTKFILPLLVFAGAGFSQGKDAPTLDPKTGLPISDKYKEPTIAELLADVLQGTNPREHVSFNITFVRIGAGWSGHKEKLFELRGDQFTRLLLGLDTPLVKSLKRKFELGLKRNKLSNEDAFSEPSRMSGVSIEVKGIKRTETGPRFDRFITYEWNIWIRRPVSTLGGKHKIKSWPKWHIIRGVSLGEEQLKSQIEDTFDKIFLAYLELPEPKK